MQYHNFIVHYQVSNGNFRGSANDAIHVCGNKNQISVLNKLILSIGLFRVLLLARQRKVSVGQFLVIGRHCDDFSIRQF